MARTQVARTSAASALASALLATLILAAPARANEICAAEFQPLIQQHQQVMQEVNRGIPRGQPRNFEQARARAQTACRLLGNAQTSFTRLQAWVASNRDFCQLPENIVRDVNTGLANVRRNRTQACNAVGQLDRQRRQAEAGGQLGANPFAPNAARRPQLDLRTPGAL